MSINDTTNTLHGVSNLSSKRYLELNAEVDSFAPDGSLQLYKDKEAANAYFIEYVNRVTMYFGDLKEKIDYLVENEYYETEFLDKYSFEFIKSLFKRAYDKKFRFQSLAGAIKFYTGYALKTFDGKNILERFEDRVAITALHSADGDEQRAIDMLDEMISGRYQPATPTFNNAGKKQRGEFVSCFLLGVEDNLLSISRSINSSLQLSKNGGGVAVCLTNVRAQGDPIKKIENQSSGVIPVMKLLEDAFSYANQLGARQGAGAVYLHAHHPDIMTFLSCRKENVDEKIRIKTLSLGVVIPDITFKLAKRGEPMYLFSPYDVEREYGTPFAYVNVNREYSKMVDNPRIRKTKIDAREFLRELAEVQFQSGYPYVMFEDNVNRANPIDGKIIMSNLCSEILQVTETSEMNRDLSYSKVGKDISCNLGSLNIAKAIDSPDFGKTVEIAIRALTQVSDISDIAEVPTVNKGNKRSHAIGLGAMNLHGALGEHRIMYGSEEGLDFTNFYFYTVAYHAIRTSMLIAKERGVTFDGFERSKYATGAYFEKYTDKEWLPATERVANLFAEKNISIPTQADWAELSANVQEYGMYNQNLQAIPPTGSISYINNSTSSILPITSKIEIRKEGKLGRVYYPAPHMTQDNLEFFPDAYAIGNEAIIATYAIAQQHIDQGMSLTLFFTDEHNTADITAAQILAHKSKIKTLYYSRLKTSDLEGIENDTCVSCML